MSETTKRQASPREHDVGKDIDVLIRRRHRQRVELEGERPQEELYMPPLREIAEDQRAQTRAAWGMHHARMAKLHTSLASEHARKAAELGNPVPEDQSFLATGRVDTGGTRGEGGS